MVRLVQRAFLKIRDSNITQGRRHPEINLLLDRKLEHHTGQ